VRGAVLWFVTALAPAVTLAAPAGSSPAVAPQSIEPPAPRRVTVPDHRPLVVVRALGHVGPAHLRHACRTILEHYPVRCEIGPARDVMTARAAWNDRRRQVDGRALLDRLFVDRTDALVEVDLTPLDIYEGTRPYVFGLASLSDRVAVVSLARVTDDFRRPDVTSANRIRKLVLHEVGHALGLGHHDDPACVMRQDGTPESLDFAPDDLCDGCRRELLRRLDLLAHPGQAYLDRVRGHLVRGEIEDARFHATRALHRFPTDAGLAIALGRAFLDAAVLNDAISLFELALHRNPDLPEAHAYRAIALDARGRPEDLARAREHFARAVELDPRWASSARGRQASALARAQGPHRSSR